VTITSDDMFNQAGQYFRAYSNVYDVSGASSTNFVTPPPYSVPPNLIGSAGPNQIWDFSTGPTDITYRFDYLAPTNSAVADANTPTDFPQATVVEQQKDEASGSIQDLFFSQDSTQGRIVYGFYTPNPLFDNTVNQFNTPIKDFPSTMNYQQTWQTSATWQNSISGIPIQITQNSVLTVDAWGTIIPPDSLGTFGPGLRVHAAVTQLTYFDQNAGMGTPSYVLEETDNSLVYYWLMPGRGIVASLASTAGQNGAVPPDNFSTATQFWRMFETNHKPASTTGGGGGCTAPQQVSDLSIKVSGGQVLLKWSKANCASKYELDYTSKPWDATTWKPLSVVSNQLLVLDPAPTSQGPARFYRVVSMQ
jgi:hypothetical protein